MRLRTAVLGLLMVLLTGLGARIELPLGPVPFSLQTMFVVVTGLLLGPLRGGAVMALYVIAGLALPLYAGGASGIDVLIGPTGGYLIGFVPAAVLAGVPCRRQPGRFAWIPAVGWGLFAHAAIFTIGVPFLAAKIGDLERALEQGLWPFLPGALIKTVAAVFLAAAIDRLWQSAANRGKHRPRSTK